MRKILLVIVLALVAVTSVQIWITQDRTTQKADMELEKRDKPSESQIGGPFTLTNQNGEKVQDTDLHGRIELVFFGFTSCPDICPVTLASLSKTMSLLGDKANQVAPVFITVDPQHDTPAVLKDFLSNFDKRMIGLTGSEDDIKKVGDAYKIYYNKTPKPGADAQKDYTIDHSAYIFMMGKDGRFLKVFPYDSSETELAHAVELVLN